MSGIRYLCVSDLHLGEEDSILTHVDPQSGALRPNETAPAAQALGKCLAELLGSVGSGGARPTLILNGDILELALSSSDVAIKTFARFLHAMEPEGAPVFEELVYLPGNHDHHLWEVARETQYRNYMRRIGDIAELEPAWHTTKVFMDLRRNSPDRVTQGALTEAARRVPHLDNFEVLTAYPNYGLQDADGAGRRAVIFHHGHFVEPAYRLMSTAGALVFDGHAMPENVYELEGENFAWIDFFWSTMGRSGKVGEHVEQIYESTASEATLSKVTDRLARNLAQKYNLLIPWSDWLEEQAFKYLLRKVVVRRVAGQHERQMEAGGAGGPLSKEAAEGLRWYLGRMVKQQILDEGDGDGRVPGDIRFVFGHTHKPFEGMIDAGLGEGGTKVYNTGGWVVEGIENRADQGGVVTLVDEELNVVNLRMYSEGDYRVRVEEPLREGESHSPLYEGVRTAVNSGAGVWKEFGETASREVKLRQEWMRKRIQS